MPRTTVRAIENMQILSRFFRVSSALKRDFMVLTGLC